MLLFFPAKRKVPPALCMWNPSFACLCSFARFLRDTCICVCPSHFLMVLMSIKGFWRNWCSCLPRQPFDVPLPVPASVSIMFPKHSWFQKSSVSLLHILSFTYTYSFLRGVNICKIKLTFPVLVIKMRKWEREASTETRSFSVSSMGFAQKMKIAETGTVLGRKVDRSMGSYWEEEAAGSGKKIWNHSHTAGHC